MTDSDEDELLQQALQEQARGPKPGPAARRFQPPPLPVAAKKTPQKGNGRSVEDDDDSEVEMLSISSGDEDNGKDQKAAPKGRTGSKGGRGVDRGWDGDEPDCWKRVDELSLARRVRAMRETRTAPVAQKFERKPQAPGRPGLNTLHTLPRGMECIDPLGLGIVDNKTLRLITDNSETSPTKQSKEHLDEDFREKLDYFSAKFDPKIFLSRIHQDTKAADLEAGALALKDDLKGRTQQRKQLVKDNFDCFVSCKTTIDDIESKLRRIEDDPEGSGTNNLYNFMQGVSSQASRALEPLLERQVQAEKIRSVQGMLQRFRTLFNLPSAIRGSISKGEYDLAVREYKKAKSISLPSNVNILKRVLEEIERVMHEFKGVLYNSMKDPQIDLTNLENIVRLLLELEPESDPIWHYLSMQNQRIRALFEKCASDHEARMEILHNEVREKAESDARWRKIHQSDFYFLDGPQPIDVNTEEADALKGRFIRSLTAVLIYHIPAFWKVALSVFSGKFAKSSQVSADANINSSTNKTEDKPIDGRYSSHSLDEVAGMIRTTISVYEVKVLYTLKDFRDSHVDQSYMSDAIKEIARACRAFEVKEAVPSVAAMALRELHSEVTKNYVGKLCSWMRSSILEISKDETWVRVSVIERNKSPYAISYLPLEFRSVVSSAMDKINLLMQSFKNEAAISEDIFAQLQETQESVRIQLLNSFLDLAANLEQIGSEVAQNKLNKDSQVLQNGYVCQNQDNLSANLPGSIVDPHKQLLMVISNIGYCKDELSFKLYNKYKLIWQHSREKNEDNTDLVDLVASFSRLEETVLEQYTLAKADLIRTAATNYLLDPSIQWGAAPAVKGVRGAAVELLHTLVAVHAEVFAGAMPLLDKTLGILVEGLIDTFLSLFHEKQSEEFQLLDANGFCQLMLELEYFETILNPFFTSDARESLKSLQGVLLEKATECLSEAAGNREKEEVTSLSPDELIALGQQCSSDLLQAELERTRINTACFVDSNPLASTPEPAEPAKATAPKHATGTSHFRGSQPVASPGFSRQRRR